MNLYRRIFWILLLTQVGSLSSYASLQRSWAELKTEHFRIVYDASQKQLATVYGRQAERARATLMQHYEHAPEVTVIFLDDSTDLANGLATSLPYPYLRIFPALPTPYDSIGDYEDWVFELLIHEYAHLLTFEHSGGIYRPLRHLLGSIARPNYLLPRWYHEGASVFWESYFSASGGRLRSPSQQGDLRAMALSQKLYEQDLSLWNEALPDWLGGRRAYLLGGTLFQHLYEKEGSPKVLPELTYSYARRLPYFLQGPVKERWGLSYQQLIAEAFGEIQFRALEQQAKISAADGAATYILPVQDGVEWRSPKFSPDGHWLAALVQGDDFKYGIRFFRVTKAGLVRAPLKFKADKKIVGFDWSPDSKSIVFDRLTAHRREATYFDLYRYDLQEQKIQRLTRGQRALEPALSPDGQKIVFRQNYGPGSRIAILGASGGQVRPLYTPPFASRVSSPLFLNDREVLFTERDHRGVERLFRLPLDQSAPPRELHPELTPIYSPRVTASGLLFRSDHTGVPNLYLAQGSQKPRALTNSSTRVLDGHLHPQIGTLVFSESGPEGPRLKLIRAQELAQQPHQPPVVKPLLNLGPRGQVAPDRSVTAQERSYRPYRYMFPKYLMPFLFFQEQGYTVQVLTGSHDPALRHMYSLQASYDSMSGKVGALGQYTFAPGGSTWSLAGGKVYEYILSGGFVRSVDLLQGRVGFFLPGLSDHWMGQIGVLRSQMAYDSVSLERAGPEVGLTYSHIRQGPDRVTPEAGGSAGLFLTKFLGPWGNISYDQWNFNGTAYQGLPRGTGLAASVRAQYAPDLRATLLGGTNLGGVYQYSLVSGSFLTRGYPTGTFIGRNIVNGSLEFRTPVSRPHKGWGTLPLFLRRTHLNFFVDALAMDGIGYNFQNPEGSNFEAISTLQWFTSAGMEYKWDVTLGYMAPAQFFLGAYYGFNTDFGGGFTPFVGLIF